MEKVTRHGLFQYMAHAMHLSNRVVMVYPSVQAMGRNGGMTLKFYPNGGYHNCPPCDRNKRLRTTHSRPCGIQPQQRFLLYSTRKKHLFGRVKSQGIVRVGEGCKIPRFRELVPVFSLSKRRILPLFSFFLFRVVTSETMGKTSS